MDKKNTIKVYTTSSNAELNISTPDMKQVISATNNRAQYFAEQAKKFRDEAKYYAEQNSDVSLEYINELKAELELKLLNKQEKGDYATREELPKNVSELTNDAEYVNRNELDAEIENVELPSQEGCKGKVLMSDGENEKWVGINAFQLFDVKSTDYLLQGEELLGWALQGTYVYKEALAGSRYGYPDFYNRVVEEFNEATSTEEVNGITIKVHSNGHKFYDIADKDSIDNFYNSTGYAWFYGVDIENERIFLPRNKWFALKGLSDVPVIGNGLGLGLTNGAVSGSMVGTQSASCGLVLSNSIPLGRSINPNETIGSGSIQNGVTGVTTNPNYSGLLAKTKDCIELDDNKYLYICVGNTTNYEGITDVVNQGMDILEQVAEKVNTDGSNLNAEGKSLFANFAMPSSRYIDLTLGASGTTYTAPASGYYNIAMQFGDSYSPSSFLILETTSLQIQHYPQNWCRVFIPVKKGDNLKLGYSGQQKVGIFRFIYAEGDQ